MYSWMATMDTRLVRPILTLLIFCFLTNSQAAVRPMLSIRATSTTETRIGFDSMHVLLPELRGSHNAKPRCLCFTDLLEADSFLGEVAFEPVPEPDEEVRPIISRRKHLREKGSRARGATRDHLTQQCEISSSAPLADGWCATAEETRLLDELPEG